MVENGHTELIGGSLMGKILFEKFNVTTKMPKMRRRQPGKYKTKQPAVSNFTGSKPLTIFQAKNGLWGVKDGDGNIEIEPVYKRIEQTEKQKLRDEVYLASEDTVLSVTPDDWDVVVWFSSEFFEKND